MTLAGARTLFKKELLRFWKVAFQTIAAPVLTAVMYLLIFGHVLEDRVQVFQGIVIRRQGDGLRESFTVRKVSYGVGVERTFPVHTPTVEKIEVVTRGDVRRAKLYYLRDRIGKAAKVKEKRDN